MNNISLSNPAVQWVIIAPLFFAIFGCVFGIAKVFFIIILMMYFCFFVVMLADFPFFIGINHNWSRIVVDGNGVYKIQIRFLLWWVEPNFRTWTINEFSTLEDAQDTLDRKISTEQERYFEKKRSKKITVVSGGGQQDVLSVILGSLNDEQREGLAKRLVEINSISENSFAAASRNK